MVIFSKIEFKAKGEILLVIKDTTLPDAIQAAKKLNPIDNYGISIVCWY